MSRAGRLAVASAVGLLVGVSSAEPALAHSGGEEFTSNYLTEITAVEPAPAALDVSIVGVEGTIEIRWSGDGTLVVAGYDGEPYLRFGPGGVARNTSSPATYLNAERYAAIDVPDTADAAAEPRWEHVSDGHRFAWHDHRTHWMDRTPPPAVRADPDEVTTIIPEWTIPFEVEGTAGAITGTLRWIPPPSSTPYVAFGSFVAVLAGTVAATRSRARFATGVAVAAVTVFAADSVAYATEARGGASVVAWLLAWPAVAVAALIAGVVARRRAVTPIPAGVAISSLIVLVIGGWDRREVFDHSQISYAADDWVARAGVTFSLAAGAAVVTLFAIGMAGAVHGRPPHPAPGQ